MALLAALVVPVGLVDRQVPALMGPMAAVVPVARVAQAARGRTHLIRQSAAETVVAVVPVVKAAQVLRTALVVPVEWAGPQAAVVTVRQGPWRM